MDLGHDCIVQGHYREIFPAPEAAMRGSVVASPVLMAGKFGHVDAGWKVVHLWRVNMTHFVEGASLSSAGFPFGSSSSFCRRVLSSPPCEALSPPRNAGPSWLSNAFEKEPNSGSGPKGPCVIDPGEGGALRKKGLFTGLSRIWAFGPTAVRIVCACRPDESDRSPLTASGSGIRHG